MQRLRTACIHVLDVIVSNAICQGAAERWLFHLREPGMCKKLVGEEEFQRKENALEYQLTV